MRSEAGVADQLARRREAADLADLARERQAEQVTDARNRLQQNHARVGFRGLAELPLERGEPLVEQLDDGKRLGDRPAPGRLHAAVRKQLHRVVGAEATEPDAQPPLGQQSEAPVHRRRPQPDQLHPPAQPLAQRSLVE